MLIFLSIFLSIAATTRLTRLDFLDEMRSEVRAPRGKPMRGKKRNDRGRSESNLERWLVELLKSVSGLIKWQAYRIQRATNLANYIYAGCPSFGAQSSIQTRK